MTIKLYTDQGNPVAWKILVAAKYANVQVETPHFEVGTDNKSAEFEKKSPLGKVPVLETSEGVIFQPNAAARFVAKQSSRSLFGSNNFEAAQVEQWIEFSANEIDLPASVWVFPILGFIQNNPTATQRAKGDIRKVLEVLNSHLADKTFLVGERLSLADFVVATSLHRLYEKVLDPAFRKVFVNANRWFTTIVNQPEYLAVAGPTTLATKMEAAPKGDIPEETKQEEKPKKAEKPKQEKPKEEKPKPEKPKETEEEVDEDGIPKEPKKKSLLDSLPPSKLVMDDWKRTYSNEDTRSVAIPWLWEHFDKEGYSFWHSDYKYNAELTKTFMTANLVSGFLQRLDKLRKYAFGSLIIFGDDGGLEVSGVWLFRGLNIPEEMTECDDAEHYNWKKLNHEEAESKELIQDYFAWDGKFGGKTKPFNQGKVFK